MKGKRYNSVIAGNDSLPNDDIPTLPNKLLWVSSPIDFVYETSLDTKRTH